ncbi:MAG TPA: hypothetical protein PLF79_02565 [Thauera sp.]|nr:hypothetical protein [Thauera sp.]
MLVPALALDRLSLRLGDVANPAFALQQLTFDYQAGLGTAVLGIGRLRVGQHDWRALELHCARAALALDAIVCRDARLRVGGRALPFVADLTADPARGSANLDLRLGQSSLVALALEPDGRVRMRADRLALADLRRALPNLAAVLGSRGRDIEAVFERYSPTGTLEVTLVWTPATQAPARLELHAALRDGGFGTSDGLQAAEQLQLALSLDAQAEALGWNWQARLQWQDGAAYLHPLYIESGPTVEAEGRLQGGVLSVDRSRARLEGVGELAASASFGVDTQRLHALALRVAAADLAVIGPRWLAPLISPASAERMRFAGHFSADVHFRDGRASHVEAVLEEAGFSFVGAAGGAGVALGPVDGRIAWRPDAPSVSSLSVGGGRWEKLALGAFELSAVLEGDSLRLAHTRVPVLDGALVVDGLALTLTPAGWQGSASAVIEPVSMPELTAALELPQMAGVLSASLPGVRVSPGEITLDGALVVSVFDGYLQATGLRLIEPFGVASHLSGDIEGRHLDLAQLTDTFSFGSVSGFVDLSLRGLELARWKPVAFDARIASSPGRYPRRISQRAVQNISALGGGGAVAAIQRSLLAIFDTFGYRELGLGCRLRAGVCLMSGVEGGTRADGGFVIVRGGGVPALDVIGYNRRVDWNELVDRLQRVIAENVSPELR